MKLTDEQVAQLRDLRARGAKLADLAAMFGVSEAQVSRIANRRRRR